MPPRNRFVQAMAEGNETPNSGDPGMNSMIKMVTLGVAGLMFILAFFSSCTIVDPGNRGIVVRLGAVQTSNVLSEGLHFVAPFITSVKEFNVRTLLDEIAATAASKDLQEVNAHLAINWHPDTTKVAEMYQKYGTRQALVQNIIQPAVNEVFKAATAKLSAEEILRQRVQLKREVDMRLVEVLSRYGIIIDDISLVNISFSAEFNKAIEQKQIAEQNAQKAVYVAQQAKQEAAAEVARAEGKAKAQALQRATISDQLIRLKALEVQELALQKWNGQLPGVTGGVIPFINVGGDK